MFCSLIVHVCVIEEEPSFHMLRGFMILLVTAVFSVSAPWEINSVTA